jgi:5-carboxymethyl-2-hydroxymuconate isomerase
MPHIRIEVSRNLADEIACDTLVERIHEAVIRTGVFSVDGIRSRLEVLEHYRVADSPQNAFVHVQMRIAPGRDDATKKRVVDAVFGELCAFLQPSYDARPLALSLELGDLTESRVNKGNLRERKAAAKV